MSHEENDRIGGECQPSSLLQAVNRALHHAMAEDERVVVLGEDVGSNGGVFRATEGLKVRFGGQRVMDTPLAEALIAGLSVGMAVEGMRPVAEIQFMGFMFAALEHLAAHAGRMRNRTRGRLSCPLVLRIPFGGGIHAPELHSESTETLLAHLPGLKVVVASSPTRAYRLLLAAIRDPDPVIFLEPKRIYRSQNVLLADDGQELPLGCCFTLRQGEDVTLLSWGASVVLVEQAAEQLALQGIEAEVIDVASLKPLDIDTPLRSLRRTGRCVIVHEAARSFGPGAEIACQLQEQGFAWLKAPIRRVTGYDTVMPYLKNEHHYLPNVARIVAEVTSLCRR